MPCSQGAPPVSHSPGRTKVALISLDGQSLPNAVVQELAHAGIDLSVSECANRADLAAHASDADVVWLFGGSRVLHDGNLAALDRCWAILRTGSGTDNVPVDEATARGILVANTPAAFSDGVSDHVIGLLFAVVRRLAALDRSMRAGRWEQATAVPLNSVEGRTLGLVGFGHVGQLLVRKLRGFEMRVLAHDPYARPETLAAHGVESADLARVFSESDFVSLHCPLTPETHHLVGEEQLRLMKPSAILINTARGPVVDEPALIRALREGRLAAAGLDVFESEPPAADNPLLKMDNVVVTPHGAGYSVNGVELRWRHSIAALAALAARRWPPSCVNRQVRPKVELSV